VSYDNALGLVLAASVFVNQRAVQNLRGFTEATTLDGATQLIATGPIASQEAIKELGTNGGAPLNASSAHPFENPNGYTILLQLILDPADPVR
jgi:potassium-transporting ATPase potassium-binding subunit